MEQLPICPLCQNLKFTTYQNMVHKAHNINTYQKISTIVFFNFEPV